MNVDVKNKVVVITGSSKGIGSKLAKAFAAEKAIVVMTYCSSKEDAENTYNAVVKESPYSLLIKADVRKAQDVSTMCREVVRKFGQIDILINNAGICDDNLIQIMPLEQWQKVIDVNLTGTFLCCREMSKIMIKRKEGKIINIASLKGQIGSLGQVNYSSSKAGIIALTKALAKEFAEYNISVNAICPGFIVTDLNRHDIKKQEKAKRQSLLSIEYALDDLINFILFFSSEKISGISGRIFNLDSRVSEET